ncbi:MAG: protein kinase domain-containing protein, partial [Vicinamibacteria bacterium]
MGTLGYMSPEQAAGRSVDFRSDQFSLGTILYEMASGRRAFRRATGPETLTAILRDQPEPLSKLNPALPAPFRWIIEERCLAKDPEERYASTRDLFRELQGIREQVSETTGPGDRTLPPRKKRRSVLVAILGGLATLAIGVWAGRYSSTLSTPEPPSFRKVTFQRGEILTALFAPDGHTIVYSARIEGRPPEIFSTRVDSPESRSLGLPPANLLSISSTGEMAIQIGSRRSIGWERTGTLARMPLAGGAPREILEDVEEADWSPDGKDLAIVRDVGGQRRLEFPIGRVLYETAGFISYARVSPRGDRVAFLDHPVRGDNAGSVSVVDLAGVKRTLSGPFFAMRGLQWSPWGEEIWFGGAKSGGHIDLWALTLAGSERLLWDESSSVDIHHVARDGTMLLARAALGREIRGRAPEAEERGLSWLDWSFPVSLSEDGSLLLFDEQGEGTGGSNVVYLRKTDGSPAVRLGDGRGLALSPDGQWVLAYSGQSLVMLPIGAGMPREFPATGMTHHGAAWLPDGERMVLVANEPDRGTRLYLQGVSGGEPRPFTPEGVSFFFSANPVSPDGKHVVARGPDRKLLLFPIEGGEPRSVGGVALDEQVIRWTADGRGLYVHLPSEIPTRIEVVNVATGRRVLWKVLAPPDPAGVD